ncbi:MAG: cell envelope biogenesis protein OmpA, partial [Pseudomonadota bacterium]
MKHFWRASLIVVVGLFFMGCAAQQSMTKDWKTGFAAQDLNAKVQSGEYVKKVDNFLVILDASGSMADAYKGKNKLNLAKDTISRMNQTIPGLDLMAALRAFGRFECWPLEESKLLYGPTNYSKGGLEGALNGVAQGRGQSPLMLALNGASQDLKAAAGQIAVIIFSDGDEEDMNHAAAINAAKALKGQFGDRICIYTVLIGNDPKGKTLMGKITDAGLCGFSVDADRIASSGEMADFVEKVFLAKAPPKPAAPAKPAAPVKAGPRDSDGDGVFDDVDRCPGTPMGARVDSKGCWILENVLFDFDKTVIKSQ